MPQEYNRESIFALGKITDADELESVAASWMIGLAEIKWPRALQYFENASYLQGNHLTRFYYLADTGFGFHNLASDKNPFDALVAKSADNKLIRPVETVASLLTQTKPRPRVTPNSTSPEDEDAAAIAEIVIDLVWERPLHLDERLREAAVLGCIASTCAIEIEYGETDSPVVVQKYRREKTRNPLFGIDDGEPAEVVTERPHGTEVTWRKDIQARLWSALHLYPDPAATTPGDMTWIGRQSFVDVDWVREHFNKKAPGYFPDNLDSITSGVGTNHPLYWWSRMQDIIESPQYYQHGGGLTQMATRDGAGSAPNQCVFSVIDVKPTAEFPRGRTIILAGGTLVYAGDNRCFIPHPDDPGKWRYPWRWHPYAFWGWFKLPGKFLHVPLLTELVPLQKKINAIDALVHINRQYMTIGQWKLPKHSKVPDGMPSGIPGDHVRYTAMPGMSEPEKVDHKPLPQELLIEREQLERSIDMISASGVIDNAQIARSAARSGAMLDFLRQEKLRSKSPMLQEFEAFIETLAQNILIELQAGLGNDEDQDLSRRVTAAAREYSGLALQTFTGASLRDHHAVKVDVASEMMKSPEAAEAKAMEYLQYRGGFLSPAERAGVMQATGLAKFVKSEEDASVARARRMISRITQGMLEAALPLPGVDNVRAMLPIFQTEILGDRFITYPPEIQKTLMALFRDYAAKAAEEEQRAFQMQMAAAKAGVGTQGGGEQGTPGAQ